MRSKSLSELIRSRLLKVLRWLAGWIIGISVLVLLMLGLVMALTHTHAKPGSFADRHPIATAAVGWLFLAVATVVLLRTMTTDDGAPSRWVKALPGLLSLAVLNGLTMLSDGHLLNNPAKPISHKDALTMTLFFAASAALLLFTFVRRHLRVVDKVVLLVFVFSMAWAFTDNSGAYPEMMVGFASLVFATAYHIVQKRHPSHGRILKS